MYVRFMSCSGVTLRCSFHCLSSSCTHAHEPFYECVELPSTSSVTEWHLHLALKLCCQLNHNMILSFTCSGRPLTSLNLQHFSVCSLPKKNCCSSTSSALSTRLLLVYLRLMQFSQCPGYLPCPNKIVIRSILDQILRSFGPCPLVTFVISEVLILKIAGFLRNCPR
jgi:hypothetical protein